MTDTIDKDADDVLAGELALRILPQAEEATARDREQSDPAFAGRVARWNEDLARLADEIAPVRPSVALWPRIAAGAFGAVAANDNGRVAFWRRWAIGSTGLLAASVAALAVMVTQPEPVLEPAAPQGGVTRVATLTLESGTAAVTLAYDAGTGHLFLSPSDAMVGDPRVPHLWLMMPDGNLQLVGAFNGTEPGMHNLDAPMADMANQAMAVAVSMEEPGHTPSTQPDGPVVAQGEISRL
jgi:anti-sigma-K factor RskA